MKTVQIGEITVSNTAPFALIAGPCQLESLAHARMMAERIAVAA
ncbi:MAG: 3-deoxy-8-phosphooctulonate synthase, partial [Pseudomonadota bacterium]